MLKMSKVALAGAIAAAAMVSTGANAATVSAQAEVDILAPVELEQTAVLDFGVVAAGAGGTVTLPTGSDTRTCSVGVTCVGAAQRGALRVRAVNSYVVAIAVQPSTTLDDPGPGVPMNLTLNSAITSITADGNWQPFNVGGTLTVGAAQAAGTYTGTYNVSADYQ